MEFDEISDDEALSNSVAPVITSPLPKPKNEEDEPLLVRVKQYMGKLKMGRKPVEPIHPRIVSSIGGRDLY